MNGLNRTSLLAGLVVALLALFGSTAFAEESVVSTVAHEDAASFDQKYLLPDYIAYNGVDAIVAASFDTKFLTPGSIVHTVSVNPDGTVVQVAHWQALINSVDLTGAFQNLEDFENKSLTAGSADTYMPQSGYVAHGNADWAATASLITSELEDFENKSLFTGSDISWVMQQTMAVANLEDFENKSLTAVSTATQTSRPGYVAHGNVDWVTQSTLEVSELEDFDDKALVAVNDEAIATAAAFDANYFMPGSIVRTLGPEMTRVHAARWQAIADYYAQYATLTTDGDVIASAAGFVTD